MIQAHLTFSSAFPWLISEWTKCPEFASQPLSPVWDKEKVFWINHSYIYRKRTYSFYFSPTHGGLLFLNDANRVKTFLFTGNLLFVWSYFHRRLRAPITFFSLPSNNYDHFLANAGLWFFVWHLRIINILIRTARLKEQQKLSNWHEEREEKIGQVSICA